MRRSDQRFWPFKPRISILSAVLLLALLLIMAGILRSVVGWPPDSSTNIVLIGILLLSLLPVLLAIVDVIIERGGTIGYGDLKIDFSKVQSNAVPTITVPANIGVRGQAVMDSSTVNILNSLQEATANSIVIIDLEDGQAWWETRLLVLLAGAERLGRPDKVVFVATQAGRSQSFIGWGNTTDLLRCLLKVNAVYQRAYQIAKAVFAQWQLVELKYPIPPQNALLPPPLPWMQPEALNKQWMFFDANTGLPNEFFEEQVLQNELGREIENKQAVKSITVSGLSELFEPVLNRDHIDQNGSVEEQMKGYFKDDAAFIALTENGKYTSLVSRFAVFNEVLKTWQAQINER
jgi:hypothetical protein